MRKILLASILTVAITTVYSQSWIEKRDQKASFFEVQAAFEAEWEGRAYEKGKGYKQFKRWEYYMESRVDENGFLPSNSDMIREYQEFKEQFHPKGSADDSQRDNSNWVSDGPFDVATNNGKGIGRVNTIAIDPTNSNIIYVGTAGGGIWKSINNGSSWTPLTSHLPVFGVTGIAINPENPDIIYIGCGDGNDWQQFSLGVLKSTDGGLTWQQTGVEFVAEDGRNVHKIVLHPDDPNTVFCASTAGLWKSTNGGDNWYIVRSGNVHDVEFHPSNPDIMYLSRPVFYRSEDGGETWDVITEGIPVSAFISRAEIAVSPDQPNYVYLLAGSSQNQGLLGVYRSLDSGFTFEERADESPNLMGWSDTGSDTGGQAWYDIALAVDPDNAFEVMVGGVNVWQSVNGGNNWNIKAHQWNNVSEGYVHADVHFLEYFGGVIYCGSDGGIFRSFNGGNTWENISNGLGIIQLYGIGTTDQDPNRITLGAQDNGSSIKEGGQWSKVFGGDGMQTHISPNNPNRVYCATQNGNLYISTDGGDDFDGYSNSIDEDGGWLTPYELRISNPNRVVAGFQNVWYYALGSWQQLSDFHSLSIDNIALSPSNDDHIYFSEGSDLYKTTNFGDDWTEISAGLPIANISGIEVRPNNPNEIIVTFSGFSDGEKVYHTTDGGETWENYTFNLPNFSVNCVAADNGSGIYIGTDFGVLYKNANLSNWQLFSADLPMVEVTDLDLLQNSGVLKAATYGRGVWSTELYTPVTSPPESEFTVSDQVVCVGESVTFYDISINGEPTWNWNFDGGTPNTASESAPEIVYNTPGIYAVSLVMMNSFGVDTETKTSYITVLANDEMLVPFEEDFESLENLEDDNWYVINENNNVTWEINNAIGYLSPSSLHLNNNEGVIDDVDEIISPTFDLTDELESKFSFNYAFARRHILNKDKMRLYFSANCGDNWSLIETFTAANDLSTSDPTMEYYIPPNTEWGYFEEIIGSQYYGPDFRVRFTFENDGGNNAFIDNINIDASTGIEDGFSNTQNIKLFPNPGNRDFVLNTGEIIPEKVVLRNLLGEVVYEMKLNASSSQNQFNLRFPELSSGIYNLEIFSSAGAGSLKVLIEK